MDRRDFLKGLLSTTAVVAVGIPKPSVLQSWIDQSSWAIAPVEHGGFLVQFEASTEIMREIARAFQVPEYMLRGSVFDRHWTEMAGLRHDLELYQAAVIEPIERDVVEALDALAGLCGG